MSVRTSNPILKSKHRLELSFLHVLATMLIEFSAFGKSRKAGMVVNHEDMTIGDGNWGRILKVQGGPATPSSWDMIFEFHLYTGYEMVNSGINHIGWARREVTCLAKGILYVTKKMPCLLPPPT